MAGDGGFVVGDGVVIVLAAHHLTLEQRDDAIAVGAGLVEARLLLGQGALGLLQRHLVRLGVDQEQRLTGGDRLPFDVGAFEQDAAHPGAHVNFAKAGGLAHHLGGQRDVGQFDLGHHHGHRWQCLGTGGGFITTGGQCAGQCQGDTAALEHLFPDGLHLHHHTPVGWCTIAAPTLSLHEHG